MKAKLSGKRVAILVTEGFELAELTGPKEALEKAGAETDIVSPAGATVRAWDEKDWGEAFDVDVPLKGARAEDYDALVLPGGVMNPDKLRMDEKAVAFVKEFVVAQKPIVAICHGPWTLIEAGAVAGRRMTSWPSLRTDLRNAGAQWVDEEVVVDNGLVTSRKPADLTAFNKKMLEEIGEGRHLTAPGARKGPSGNLAEAA